MEKFRFEKLEQFLNSSDNVIVCGHENPDPDAICSCIAIEHLLSTLGKNILCINSDATPEQLKVFDYKEIINSIEDGYKLPDNIEDYNLLIVDTNIGINIGTLYDLIMKKIKKVFIIDHHSQKDDSIQNYIIEASASSTSEIIYRLYEYFDINVPKEICDAIYAGIIFDSGSFHYPKTSAYTFKIASEMVEKGTDPNKIYLTLFEHESIESLKIFSYTISTLKLYENDTIAFLKLTKSMLKKSGAEYDDCASFINYPLRSHHIKAVIYFKENIDGTKRISIRSKGNIDVARIAISYNGGGHKNAAGFKLKDPVTEFDNILSDIIKNIKKQM